MADVHFASIIFTGRVQGVGFRYTALQAAKEFEVAGWVANLADGRVQLEAEGRPEEVTAFVAAVEARLHGHVRNTERSGGVRAAQASGFIIK